MLKDSWFERPAHPRTISKRDTVVRTLVTSIRNSWSTLALKSSFGLFDGYIFLYEYVIGGYFDLEIIVEGGRSLAGMQRKGVNVPNEVKVYSRFSNRLFSNRRETIHRETPSSETLFTSIRKGWLTRALNPPSGRFTEMSSFFSGDNRRLRYQRRCTRQEIQPKATPIEAVKRFAHNFFFHIQVLSYSSSGCNFLCVKQYVPVCSRCLSTIFFVCRPAQSSAGFRHGRVFGIGNQKLSGVC